MHYLGSHRPGLARGLTILILAAGGGLIPPLAELYQVNGQAPASLPAGDHAVVAEIGGTASRSDSSCCFLTIQP